MAVTHANGPNHFFGGKKLFTSRCLVMLALALSGNIQAKESLVILPAQFKLSGAAAQQTLLVEQLRDHHFVGQITNDITFASSDTNVVTVKDDVALPIRNGVATVQVKVGGQTVSAQVTVENMEKPFEWSFRNHVQPVLAKAGCSAGACHGAAAGQNGIARFEVGKLLFKGVSKPLVFSFKALDILLSLHTLSHGNCITKPDQRPNILPGLVDIFQKCIVSIRTDGHHAQRVTPCYLLLPVHGPQYAWINLLKK